MEALGSAGFPVPHAVDHNRHAVLMSLVNAVPLVQVRAHCCPPCPRLSMCKHMCARHEHAAVGVGCRNMCRCVHMASDKEVLCHPWQLYWLLSGHDIPLFGRRYLILFSVVWLKVIVAVQVKLADPGTVYIQLMDMLGDLASRGLVHCDFNEFNILVRPQSCCSPYCTA